MNQKSRVMNLSIINKIRVEPDEFDVECQEH